MTPGNVGKIACIKTEDLSQFEELGIVLDEPWHLSFPFVFSNGGDTFMVPEAQKSGEIPLYRFSRFPDRLEKSRTLVAAPYADPFLVKRDGIWYLFATSSDGLEIFFSEDLLDGDFAPHPRNPVCTDPRYSRSGGGPINIDGQLVRVSQDCSETYGANASLIGVTELTPENYLEELRVPEFFAKADFWNREGAHHLSVASFAGREIAVADGLHRDFVINKLLQRLYR